MEKENAQHVEPFNLIEGQVDTGPFPWMDMVVRRWARLLESTLFQSLGVMFDVEPFPVESTRFEKFCQTIAQKQPLYLFDTHTYGQGMIAIKNEFANACIEHRPEQPEVAQTSQLPTFQNDKHQRLHKVLSRILKDFESSWQGISEVTINLTKVTTHLFRARIMVPYEKCVVSRIAFHNAEFSSELSLCFPYLSLDKITQKQRKKHILPPEALDHYYDNIKSHFKQMLVEGEYVVSAQMGTVQFAPDQANLAIGQILPLKSSVGKEMVVKVNDIPVLTGEAGLSEDKYAIRLLGEYKEKKETFRKRPRPFQPLKWPKA